MGADRPRLASPDPYAAIGDLAELEHRLLDEGRLDEFQALEGRWLELAGSLPATPPAHAREPLRRALAKQMQISELLLARRTAMLAELASLARAGRAAEGYARGSVRRASSVDQSV